MVILLNKIITAIVTPAIYLMFALAVVVFLWGVVKFIYHSADDKERATGAKSILWGLVGIAIMVSVFGIMNIVVGTLGL